MRSPTHSSKLCHLTEADDSESSSTHASAMFLFWYFFITRTNRIVLDCVMMIALCRMSDFLWMIPLESINDFIPASFKPKFASLEILFWSPRVATLHDDSQSRFPTNIAVLDFFMFTRLASVITSNRERKKASKLAITDAKRQKNEWKSNCKFSCFGATRDAEANFGLKTFDAFLCFCSF